MRGVSLNHLAVAAFAFDEADRVVSWNPVAAELYGLSPAEAAGQSVLLFVPHEATADYLRAVAVVHEQGRWHGELRTVAADHSPRVVDAAWSSVEFPGRRIVIALHTDVTGRLHQQREERQTAGLRAVRSVGRELAGERPAVAQRLRLVTEWDDVSLMRGDGRGVLVAGGDRLTRELLRQLLVGHDYAVFVAETPGEAVELLRRFRDGIAAAVCGTAVADGLRRVRPLLPAVEYTPGMAGRELLEMLAMAITEEGLMANGAT